MPVGTEPTAMGAPMTALVVPSMTVTVLSVRLDTYTRLLLMLTPMPCGLWPTGIVAMTVLFVPSMTETVLLALFVTYTRLIPECAVMPMGLDPTGMGNPIGI